MTPPDAFRLFTSRHLNRHVRRALKIGFLAVDWSSSIRRTLQMFSLVPPLFFYASAFWLDDLKLRFLNLVGLALACVAYRG
jgi:hypothetical protein